MQVDLKWSAHILFCSLILLSGCEQQTSQPTTVSQIPEIPDLRIPSDSPSSTKIRVLLTTPSQFSISSTAKLIIESGTSKKLVHPTNHNTLQNIKFLGNNKVQLDKLGIVELPVSITSNNSATSLELNGHRYLGKILLKKNLQHDLTVINELDLESYVASVVDSEMPISFGVEARKAQAILARTYALAHILEHRSYQPYDLTDSTRHQKYHGIAYQDKAGRWLSSMTKESQLITQQTTNLICSYNNKPFVTYYCACCGGHTLDSEDVFPTQKPNFKGKPDPWCQDSPNINWQVTIPRSQAIQQIMHYLNQQASPAAKKITNFSGMSRVTPTSKDKLPRWTIRDGNTKHQISAVDLRRCWKDSPIPSPRFQIQINDQEFTLQGHGSGHSVGLCQWGASGMSKAGKSATEIIHFYYDKVDILNWKNLPLKIQP